MTTITTNPVTQQVAAPVTKRSITAEIYKRMVNESKYTRKDIIAEFVDLGGCTQQGASTYYSNFKSGTWKVEGVTGSIVNKDVEQPIVSAEAAQVAINLEQMDEDELIAYYSSL